MGGALSQASLVKGGKGSRSSSRVGLAHRAGRAGSVEGSAHAQLLPPTHVWENLGPFS